jgi:hypothetical protein
MWTPPEKDRFQLPPPPPRRRNYTEKGADFPTPPAIYIDAASIEGVLSGLMKRQVGALNAWERRALLDLTTVLLKYDEVLLPVAPEAGVTMHSHPPDIELIKSILHDFLKEKAPQHHVKKAARAEADRWLSLHGNSLVSQYRLLWNSDPANDLLHFEMSATLLYDARRFGGLIDNVTLKHIAHLFDWSKSDYSDVAHYVRDTRLLDAWQRQYFEKNTLSVVPSILLEACILGCMVRGRYYVELSRLTGADGVWHPTRDYIEPYESPFLKAPRGVQYIVGMIVVGAMLERNCHDVCETWATNIKRAKTLSLRPLFEEGYDASAERAAVDFAQQAQFVFRSKRLERILVAVHDYLIGPMLLVAGYLAYSHIPYMSPESLLETIHGPLKSRLIIFADTHAKQFYGNADEYRHLLEHGKEALLK